MKQKRPVTGLLIALVAASVCLVIYWGTQTPRADELASLMMGAFFYASAALVAVILYYGYRVKQADRMAAMGQQSAAELSEGLLERYESVYLVREAGSFFLSRISTLLMDMAIMFVAVTLLGMNDKIAKLIVQVIVTIANYVISKFFVFQKK